MYLLVIKIDIKYWTKTCLNCQNPGIRTIALAAMFHFEQIFVFCMLINKNVLEWFLLIICKEPFLPRFTNLFSFVFLISIRSVDAQYWTVTLSNWQKQSSPEVFYEERCSLKLCDIHRKTSMLESLFNFI